MERKARREGENEREREGRSERRGRRIVENLTIF